MPGIGTLPLMEFAKSRNSPTFGLDERDQPELRDSSEPLEVLKLELEALKLGQVKSRRDMLTDPSWERVQSVRDSLAAEIEVRKRQKEGSWKSKEDEPDPIIESSLRDGPPSPQNFDISFRGTEDNPIPVTMSLEQSSKSERQSVVMIGKHAVTRSLPERKPPLVPRSRPYSSSLSSSSSSLPPQTPLLPVKQQVHKPELVSSNSKANKAVLTNNNAGPDAMSAVVKKPEPSKSIRPIAIETLDPAPGRYNVPIFVDDGENPVVIELEPNYSQTNRVVVAPTKAPRALGEKTYSQLLNSSLMKSAYSNAESDANWPEELQVTPKQSADVIDFLATIYSEEAPGYLIDLSQMDADELEAEYARLVNGGGQDMAGRQATSKDESTVFPLVGSLLSKNKENQKEKEDENYGDTNATGVEELETVTIIPSSTEETTVKVKPLDQLRQKSMVCSISSGEQDVQSTDGINSVESGQPSPVNNESEEEEDKDIEPHEATEKVMENLMVIPVETRNEPPETLHRSSSVGQEPPATLRQYYSRSRSLDHGVCSVSDADEESLSYASIEEQHSETNDRSRGTIKHDRFSSVFKDKGTRTGRTSKATRKKKARSDYSYIESVVAEYFGTKKNRLTENGACGTNGGYKNTVFTNTSHGCGCTMAFQ